MRGRRLCAIVALLLAEAVSIQAHAADANGNFALKGGGSAACSTFIQARKINAPEVPLFAGWVDGYITAVNQVSPETFDVAPWQTTELLLTLVENYCRDHPEDQFILAVGKLTGALFPKRLTEHSDTVMIGGRGVGTPIYEEILRRAQVALRDSGHFAGEADARYTEELRSAIERFQREQGVESTGLLDQRTLYELFIRRAVEQAGGPTTSLNNGAKQ